MDEEYKGVRRADVYSSNLLSCLVYLGHAFANSVAHFVFASIYFPLGSVQLGLDCALLGLGSISSQPLDGLRELASYTTPRNHAPPDKRQAKHLSCYLNFL